MLTAAARTVVDHLAYYQILDLIRTVLVEEELMLLVEIADGRSYDDLARDRHITVSSLKSKAFRVREKVRSSGISATLRHGLWR
jgi:DNA-directed RNA polymerase specialized sigma24 family protein